MSSDVADSAPISYCIIPNFTFASGGVVHDLKVAYRVIKPTGEARGTILIPTCYGGRIESTLTFTSKPHDCLQDYRVVVVAMLGHGESSSPSNEPFFPPQVVYQDCIKSQYHVLVEHLGIDALEAVIGFSMGGQQAFYWAVMYPRYVKRIVAICASARNQPTQLQLSRRSSHRTERERRLQRLEAECHGNQTSEAGPRTRTASIRSKLERLADKRDMVSGEVVGRQDRVLPRSVGRVRERAGLQERRGLYCWVQRTAKSTVERR